MYEPTQPGIDTSGIGVQNVQALTLMRSQPFEPTYTAEASQDTVAAAVANNGNPTIPIIALIGGLAVLAFVRGRSEHLASKTIGLNAFNFTVMIFTVMLGIALAKVVFTKYPVPGVTQLVHAI